MRSSTSSGCDREAAHRAAAEVEALRTDCRCRPGITLEESIARFGHRKGTKTREIACVLRGLGFECPDRLRKMSEPPLLGIGALRREDVLHGNWHWVVFDGFRVWDGSPDGTDSGLGVSWPGSRVTSYLPIEDRRLLTALLVL